MNSPSKNNSPFVSLLICTLCFFRLFIASDQSFVQQYGAADSALYVERAYSLLMGMGLGHYDAMTFFKLPSISFLVAGVRFLGIPFFLFQNLLLILAASYLFYALKGVTHSIVYRLLGFTLVLFHPVGYSGFWQSLFRESIEFSLVVLLFASLLVLFSKSHRQAFQRKDVVIFSLLLSAVLLLREDAKVFWGLLPLVGIALYIVMPRPIHWGFLASIVFLPIVVFATINQFQREFVHQYYGVPILHELGEGEFPRLVGALRSIKKRSDNRYIHIEHRNIEKLAQLEPALRPVVRWYESRQLPGHGTEGCVNFGICDEMSGAETYETLKKALFQVGLTPNFVAAQKFYGWLAERVQFHCSKGRLECQTNGIGLFPTPHLKWSRVFVQNGIENLIRTLFFRLKHEMPKRRPYRVSVKSALIWQHTVMTHDSDTLGSFRWNERQSWKNYSDSLFNSLTYWKRYPDVAASSQYGVNAGMKAARKHYLAEGIRQKRKWASIAPFYPESSRIGLRRWMRQIFSPLVQIVAVLGLIGVWMNPKPWLRAYMIVVAVFVCFRIGALSYVEIYMGVGDRLFYSTHMTLLVLGAVGIPSWAPFILRRARRMLSFGHPFSLLTEPKEIK